ncbi:hypothetical protein GCM10027020_09460 [Nocardioides salsibiostraticola]
MPATKIQDDAEVRRWFTEGRTYRWMVDEYLEQYNIETVPSMWGNYRRRMGITRRTVRNDDLIPWPVKLEHRYAYPVMMLRAEGRTRQGAEVSDENKGRLRAWHVRMEETNTVLHYDPETEQGWFYVPRRDEFDTDLIREPLRKTTPHLPRS